MRAGVTLAIVALLALAACLSSDSAHGATGYDSAVGKPCVCLN
jgi:hypothetical protein